MGDGIKGDREIQEDEEADVVGVRSHEEVIGDPDEGGLGAVLRSVARLKCLVELLVGQVLMELGGHCSFQDFTVKWKVRDWAVIIEVSRVESGLFEDG